ncbi:MAG: TrkA C-terminal domain-containing protein, partial [Limisphaerales bacterium]
PRPCSSKRERYIRVRAARREHMLLRPERVLSGAYRPHHHLAGEYRVVELRVKEEDWLAGKTLAQARLRDEGIVVLGIQRPDGTYLGAPKGDKEIFKGDVLLLYGRVPALEELDRRRCDDLGDREHIEAVDEQQHVIHEEHKLDPAGQGVKKEESRRQF